MLYTVVPLERIYSYRTESILGNSSRNKKSMSEEEKIDYKQISLPNGRIYARRDGENFVVDGIYSTDMGDYLNNEYSPGSIIKL
ncbi:MAG: hypothetical protein K0S41_3499 [Anaerocolumna sp.]|jgi:hypothetical protein|nr:hypothetical protein [Anaerocolumna sp.]